MPGDQMSSEIPVETGVKNGCACGGDSLQAITAALSKATVSALESQEGGAWHPPAKWFTEPEADHGIRIEDDGRVHGLLARWDEVHMGIKGEPTPPPRNPSGRYPSFHQDNAVLELDDGTRIHPGLLTTDIGHGDGSRPQAKRVAHYDNPGAMAAAVIAGENEKGIWVAGAVLPEVVKDADRFTRLKLARFSGHWEPVDEGMELVAATGVNVPGFQNPSRSGFALAASLTGDGMEAAPGELRSVAAFLTALADRMEGEGAPAEEESADTPVEPVEAAAEVMATTGAVMQRARAEEIAAGLRAKLEAA